VHPKREASSLKIVDFLQLIPLFNKRLMAASSDPKPATPALQKEVGWALEAG